MNVERVSLTPESSVNRRLRKRQALTPPPARSRSAVQLDLTAVAGKLVEGRRKDLQAIVEANNKSYAGIQAVVQRQTAMLKQAISQWQALAGSVSVTEPRESISKLHEMARASFQSSLGNNRELAELAGRRQTVGAGWTMRARGRLLIWNNQRRPPWQ